VGYFPKTRPDQGASRNDTGYHWRRRPQCITTAYTSDTGVTTVVKGLSKGVRDLARLQNSEIVGFGGELGPGARSGQLRF